MLAVGCLLSPELCNVFHHLGDPQTDLEWLYILVGETFMYGAET